MTFGPLVITVGRLVIVNHFTLFSVRSLRWCILSGARAWGIVPGCGAPRDLHGASVRKSFHHQLYFGFHGTPAGRITQSNKLTSEQKLVLDALKLKPLKRYLDVPTPKTTTRA